MTLPGHIMPELLAIPSLPPGLAAPPNDTTGSSGASVGIGGADTPPGLTFAALLHARLAPADASSRLEQLSALLAKGMVPAAHNTPGNPADLGAQQNSTGPVELAAGGLAALVSALFQQAANTTSSAPTDEGDESDPSTLGLAQPLTENSVAAIPLTPPVQAVAMTSTGDGDNPQASETPAESIASSLADKHTPHQGASIRSASDGPAPAKDAPETSTTTAIVADGKTVAKETISAEGKTSPEGPGHFQELLAAAQGTTQNTTKAQGVAVGARIETPVGNPGWGNEVGDKLVWMAHRAESRAELVLNPPQMGRIEVSITLNGDQANAIFVSANPSVRDALESALPRLREILAEAGIQLDQAQVGADSPGNAANNGESGDNPRRRGTQDGENFTPGIIPIVSAPPHWQATGVGLVDTFA